MKIEIKKFGNILISRSSGKEAYLAMSAYLTKDVNKDELIEIDFSGVTVLAAGWADEVITKIFQNFRNVKLLHTDNPSAQVSLKILEECSDLKIS
jgi:hypothetical protein